jgi:hypothetical protein
VTDGRHTAALRTLYREHLGLPELEEAHAPTPTALTANAADDALADPGLQATYVTQWLRPAQRNTRVYRDVFRCIPDDTVATWAEYRRFIGVGVGVGSSGSGGAGAAAVERGRALEALADLQGHIVVFPTLFLRDADWREVGGGASETLLPVDIFI